jgi:MoxR-like ATPase
MATAVRQHARVAFGPSPQACRALIQMARMHAVFAGIDFVRPKDVDDCAGITHISSHHLLSKC